MIATIREIRNRAGRVVGAGIFPRGDKATGLELARIAYAGDGAEMTGVQVADEFETMSGPILVSAVTSLGEIYDAALTMAFERSADLEIGSGWPPVAIGLDAVIPVTGATLHRAGDGDVEAYVAGGPMQSIAVIVTTRDVSVAALRRAAESCRSLLRAPKSLAVAVSTALPVAGGSNWTSTFDEAVRRATSLALERKAPQEPVP
ncbi:MAG: hypothetical protein IT175_14755 [Acidobacteria bacterium]|nr:hypothetical protein [Acidobacteriota bacterium]